MIFLEKCLALQSFNVNIIETLGGILVNLNEHWRALTIHKEFFKTNPE